MSSFNKSTFREYIESIVVAVILALFIRTWVVQAFKIPTGSMEQNLLIGDHLLVNKKKIAKGESLVPDLNNVRFINSNPGIGDMVSVLHLPKFLKKHNLNSKVGNEDEDFFKKIMKKLKKR